jgi:hypothetical protein
MHDTFEGLIIRQPSLIEEMVGEAIDELAPLASSATARDDA